ncbi:hypothetical protein K435DRAFT_659686, partial [Dendrothele bispora CBS 962.96]
ICAVEIQDAREKGDTTRSLFWTDVLKSLVRLTVDGMSDDETDEAGQEQIKVVKSPEFRHPDFSALFKRVDETPQNAPGLFPKSGRKRLRRVYSGETTARRPPENLPLAYYNPRYLEQLERKLTPHYSVPIAKQDKIPIPR